MDGRTASGGLSLFHRARSTSPICLRSEVWKTIYSDGRLQLKAKFGFPRQPEEGWQVEAQLFDPKGKPVFERAASIDGVPAGEHFSWPRLQAEFDEPVKKPLLWSAELPTSLHRRRHAQESRGQSDRIHLRADRIPLRRSARTACCWSMASGC